MSSFLSLPLSLSLSLLQYRSLWIAQSAPFLVKKHFSSQIGLCGVFFFFFFFFFVVSALKKFAVPEEEEGGEREGGGN